MGRWRVWIRCRSIILEKHGSIRYIYHLLLVQPLICPISSGERIGSLSFVCSDSKEKRVCITQLKRIVRTMYSNPALHPARVVHKILTKPEFKISWYKCLDKISKRLHFIRKRLFEELTKLKTPLPQQFTSAKDWNHIVNQKGLYCFTGLTSTHVEYFSTFHNSSFINVLNKYYRFWIKNDDLKVSHIYAVKWKNQYGRN